MPPDTILQSISEGVFTAGSEWRIDCLNKATENITGFRWWEAHSQKRYELMHANLCESGCLSKHPGRGSIPQRIPETNRTTYKFRKNLLAKFRH